MDETEVLKAVINTSLIKKFIPSDPEVLADVIKNFNRKNEIPKLIRRLETSIRTICQVKDVNQSDDDTKSYLSCLVHCCFLCAESMKMSRALEKFWQPYISIYADWITGCFCFHVMEVLKTQSTGNQAITKLSLLLEQNENVQLVIKQNLQQVLCWINEKLTSLRKVPPVNLTLAESQCLYYVVKICLLIFQYCASAVQSSIWGVSHDKEGQDMTDRYILSMIGTLIHILNQEGYATDCVLLSGTAMTLMLNSAPEAVQAIQAFSQIFSHLASGSSFSIKNLKDKAISTDGIDAEVKNFTPKYLGALSLLRGMVVCGKAEILLHTCILSNEQAAFLESSNQGAVHHQHCLSANRNSEYTQQTTNESTVFHLKLFAPVAIFCKGEITLQYQAFQLLLLWYRRLKKMSANSDFNRYNLSLVFNQTLELIWLNWDSPVEDAAESVETVLESMMDMAQSVPEKYCDLANRILNKLVQTSWYIKGRYRILGCLMKFMDTSKVIAAIPDIQKQLLKCLSTNHLASCVTDVYQAFVTQIQKQYKPEEQTSAWKNNLLNIMVQGLTSSDSLIQYNSSLHWLPCTLKLLPSTSTVILENLTQRLESSPTPEFRQKLVHAWVVVVKVIRRMFGKVDFKNNLLREAMFSMDDDVRSEAIASLCVTLKKAEPLCQEEATLLQKALPYNLKVDSAPFRQHLGSDIRKLIVRIRDSCISMLKELDENKALLDLSIGFVDCLHELCISNLIPGSCYQRRKTSLDLLHVTYETLLYSPDSRCKKGYVPEGAMQLVEFAQSKGKWNFFSSLNAGMLILCLTDGADEIQESAYQLLKNYFPWPVGDVFEQSDAGKQYLACHLLSEGLRLCNSPKAHHSQSGVLLCRLVHQKYVRDLNWSFQFAHVPEKGTYTVSVHHSHKQVSIIFLQSLIHEIQKCIGEAKKSLVKASKMFPIHGLIAALTQCLKDIDHFPEKSLTEPPDVVMELVSTCIMVTDMMLGLMATEAGQEVCPSFAEIGMAMECLLQEDQSDYNENPAISPEFQYLLSWCWMNIKESCASLAEVIHAGVSGKYFLSLSMVQTICDTFLKVLTKCRHKGVIEGCRLSFSRFCAALFTSDSEEIQALPFKIMDQVLLGLKRNIMAASITRKSAGLPVILQAILVNEKKYKKSVILEMAVEGLFEIASLPLPERPNEHRDLPQVHGLNMLKSLFCDASLSIAMMAYTGKAVILVIQLFGSPAWAIRNAATRLFSSLVTRIFGQKRGGKEIYCSAVTLPELSTHYSDLPDFLMEVLTSATQTGSLVLENLNPQLFPVLTILASLSPSEASPEQQSVLTQFRDRVSPLFGSPVCFLRQLAASAYAALVPLESMITVIQMLMKKIGEMNQMTDHNLLHGQLLTVDKLLEYLQNIKYSDHEIESIWICCLKDCAWLLQTDSRCALVSAHFVKIIRCLLSKGQYQPKSQIRDLLMSLLRKPLGKMSHMAIGHSQLYEETVQCLFTMARNAAEDKLYTSLIEECIQSEELEVRKACLPLLFQMTQSDCVVTELIQRVQDALCQQLHVETYLPNLTDQLRLVTEFYVRHGLCETALKNLISTVSAQKISQFMSNDGSLGAAALPVFGISIQHQISLSDAGLQVWCESLYSASDGAQNDTWRMAAAIGLQIVGNKILQQTCFSKNSQLEYCSVLLLKASLNLILDDDTMVRAACANFVANLQWSSKTYQYSSIHSNTCLKILYEYISSEFWWSLNCVEFFISVLYQPGAIRTILMEKTAERQQHLYEQEDNNFFSERLFNVLYSRKTLESVLKKCQENGKKNILHGGIIDPESISVDVDFVLSKVNAVPEVINVTTECTVLASIVGLVSVAAIWLDQEKVVNGRLTKSQKILLEKVQYLHEGSWLGSFLKVLFKEISEHSAVV
ncbi:hypothetical protein CHS0354_013283 [Potamilus streckersoni]|uniref:DUF2428 domain-containing protein n=1 Tax=Potamilus streckersoni TaxID=2493646 RepID=A0AAE0SZD9_9BIVA|nr:hypothetical protein CHS0354_013283 [Potamilus streckersoni]